MMGDTMTFLIFFSLLFYSLLLHNSMTIITTMIIIIKGPLIREKLMSGKLFIEWRHSLCAEITRQRYMDQEIARQAHKEIVNLFFPQEENEESDESRTEEKSDKSGNIFFYFLVKY